MSDASIALNRFGLGARPSDTPPAAPKRWLIDQFARYEPRPALLVAAPTSAQAAADYAALIATRREVRQEGGGRRQRAADTPMTGTAPAPREAQPELQLARAQTRENYTASVGLRMNAALTTPAPFVERLVHFWANHFAVSADKQQVVGFAGPFEFEAIRPHVLGRFRDLLLAVERHPAMLLYLDQAPSTGPNSPLGQRVAARPNGRKLGLNENLAREIMELHTLGVKGGYSQGDVTEFARALTGWTVTGLRNGPVARLLGRGAAPGAFVFAPALHESGARTVLGKSYPAGGEAQAVAVLDDLAAHPATARHVATKLVRHLIADDPPPAAVARVEAAFAQSGGDLPTVYRALIESPEAWAPAPAKFKTPFEWSVSALRALGIEQIGTPQAVGLLQQLGQPTWRPGSPAGWDDIAASWAGPDALMRRVEAAERFAGRQDLRFDPRERAATLFPAALSPATAQAIARAESPAQGTALMLVSPEFLRR